MRMLVNILIGAAIIGIIIMALIAVAKLLKLGMKVLGWIVVVIGVLLLINFVLFPIIGWKPIGF
jgi:hypothetical protein